MQQTSGSQGQTGFFRLLIIVVTGAVLFFAAEGLMNFALGAGVAWSGETRHGVLAERGVSLAVASVSGNQPTVPVEEIFRRAQTGLFVFDLLGAQSVKLPRAPRLVDAVWLDASLLVISTEDDLDLSLAEQAIASPQGDPALFLLVAPAGFAAESGVRRGDRLVLI